MKVFLILIALIIAITLYNQKYLGKLAPGIIVLSLLFLTFRSHIENLWKKETESFSEKDNLKASLVSFWNFAEGDKEGVYFSTRAGGNNNAEIVKNEGLVLSSPTDWAETDFINEPLTGSKSLVAWATVKDADKSKGGAPISIFKDENQNFDGIIWAEREKNKWMIGSNSFKRTNTGATTTPDSPINKKQCIVMTQDYSGDNIIIKLYIDGEKVDEYTSPDKTTYEAGKWRLYFGPRHTNRERTRRDGHFIGTIHAAGLFDKALTEDEINDVNSLLDLQLSKIEDNIVYSNFENFTFNNTNKELSDSNDLKLTDKFTVMAWVKQKEKTNDWVRIIGKGNKTNRNYGLWVKGKDGQLLSQVYTSKYSNVRVANSYLENDKWTHLAMTFHKDNKQKLYKDGQLIKKEDTSGTPLTDDEPLTIGGAEFHSKFKGVITGAIVLNRVLRKEEIKKFAESPDKTLDEILGKQEKQFINIDGGFPYPDGGYLKNKDNKRYTRGWALSNGFKGSKEDCEDLCNQQPECKVGECESTLYEQDERCYCKFSLTSTYDKQLLNSLNGKYDVSYRGDIRQGVTMEINDGKARQKSTDGSTKFDETVQTKDIKNKCTEESDQDKTFYIENTYGKGKYECLKKDGDNIKGNHYFANKTLYGEVKYTPLDTKPSGTGTLPVSEMVSDAKSGDTYKLTKDMYSGMGTQYRNLATSFNCDKEKDPNSEACKKADKALALADDYRNEALDNARENISPDNENINQFTQPPTLTKGLTTENVTPSPIYFAPGTVKYGGLGYKPSYEDINYMNNKFITKPEVVNDFNKRGFCDLENNIMENIDEKCEKLPKDVCASTSCCVLLGDQRCVQGNKQGPTNKGIYNDTTIKNKDAYYYRGKCFGNCSDVPNTTSIPEKMPDTDAINPSPEGGM